MEMEYMKSSDKQLWLENILKYDLGWPDENIIRFINKNYRHAKKSNMKIMDLGCGSGRNSVFLAAEGFKIYAVDYHKENVDMTVTRVKETGRDIVGIQNFETDIPIEDSELDCAIGWGVLFLSIKEKRIALLKNINRVLKKDALFFSNWRSKEDYFYGKGIEIEENVFMLDDSAEKHGIAGMTYYFADIADLKDLYQQCGFEIYNVEKREFTIDNMQVRNSHWHIWAKKL
jgi:tRNA (uracil-5-)-methyltransferase TRM9